MSDTPHLPQAAQIDSYGNGGFRFGGMSHRGSILCLPSGVWAVDAASVKDLDAAKLARVLDPAAGVKHCMIGTGKDIAAIPAALREPFREHGITLEVMTTGAAIRTYNILISEGRPVAALLVAVE